LTADVIVDLQYGDCGKGKVAHHLCQSQKYTHVLRYNGGANAGHTIFHKGKKFITHQIPAGVFFGIKSIVGNGCVLDPVQFFNELKMLEEGRVDTKDKIFVAENAHIITDAPQARKMPVRAYIDNKEIGIYLSATHARAAVEDAMADRRRTFLSNRSHQHRYRL